jgi:hypothetical protein
MAIRELTKSVITLPWALSLFGVQQAANLLSPSATDRFGDVGRALDAVSNAAADHFDGWAKQTYRLGDVVQRTLVDLSMLRMPDIDSDLLTPMAGAMQSTPLFQTVMKYGMPPVGWVDSMLVPRQDAPAVSQEFSNKLAIVVLATQLQDASGVGARRDEPLAAIVARSAELETFSRLWALEVIGYHAGDRELARSGAEASGLLVGPETAKLPTWSLTMLHAGVGTSFANFVLKDIARGSTPGAVQHAIARFVALCRASSRRGYAGAAYASLGLTARTRYPHLVRLIDSELPAVEPGLRSYFWHGVGRAIYFEPANLLPSANAPWRGVRGLDEEAPDDAARRNIAAGFMWALTAVNLRHPLVMESFLRHHGSLAKENDAFTSGVVSSILVRYDTTRDDAWIFPFVRHVPAQGDAAAMWRTLITAPCEDALQRTYPRLREAHTLEELFHCRVAT